MVTLSIITELLPASSTAAPEIFLFNLTFVWLSFTSICCISWMTDSNVTVILQSWGVVEVHTWVRAVVDSPGDDRRWCSLSVAWQGQTLSFVQGYITWQLLEDRPHVDGQVDVSSYGACCIGSHTCKHSSISWLHKERKNWLNKP